MNKYRVVFDGSRHQFTAEEMIPGRTQQVKVEFYIGPKGLAHWVADKMNKGFSQATAYAERQEFEQHRQKRKGITFGIRFPHKYQLGIYLVETSRQLTNEPEELRDMLRCYVEMHEAVKGAIPYVDYELAGNAITLQSDDRQQFVRITARPELQD